MPLLIGARQNPLITPNRMQHRITSTFSAGVQSLPKNSLMLSHISLTRISSFFIIDTILINYKIFPGKMEAIH